MTRRARDCVWWPELNRDVKQTAKNCRGCLSLSQPDPQEPMCRREMPSKAWIGLSLGKIPTELLRSKSICFRIPAVRDIAVARPPGDGTRDRDVVANARGKGSKDSERRAQESLVTVGDIVVLKNQSITNKLTPTFADEDYMVMNKSRSRLTVQNDKTRKTDDRTTSHMKRILERMMNEEATVEKEPFVQRLPPRLHSRREVPGLSSARDGRSTTFYIVKRKGDVVM